MTKLTPILVKFYKTTKTTHATIAVVRARREAEQETLSALLNLPVMQDEECNKDCGWVVGGCEHPYLNNLRKELREAFKEFCNG